MGARDQRLTSPKPLSVVYERDEGKRTGWEVEEMRGLEVWL